MTRWNKTKRIKALKKLGYVWMRRAWWYQAGNWSMTISVPSRGFSKDMLQVAERAVAASDARKDEDVSAWAARLANDVANATD